ncbi:MAG TPA: hypothetical protein VGU66_15715 [Candidatus Elarobacter sp.]|nr:hypothetical protein [Candidatus Elarobacter sp.]
MGDDSEQRRTDRSNAMWQKFLDLVPPQPPAAAPAPKPVPEPESDAAKARAIELQILKDRQAADQKIFDYQKKAQEDAFTCMQTMHDEQNGMKL